MSVEVVVRREIPQPPASIWQRITAFRAYPERIESYVSLEMLTDSELGVGSRWSQVQTVFGRDHAQEMKVDTWKPPHELVLSGTERGARYVIAYSLEPSSEGTTLALRFSVDATNPVTRLVQLLIGRRLIRATGEAMVRDLDDLLGSIGGRQLGQAVP